MASTAAELTREEPLAKPPIGVEQADAGFDFLATQERVSYTRAEELAVIRKIDRVLMPLVRLLRLVHTPRTAR